MRFACLGSGSKGNCWVIEAGDTRVMIDCGFAMRETAQRLERLGLSPEQIDGVAITHEHSDHVRGVARFAARYGCPVWLTHGSYTMIGPREEIANARIIDSHAEFRIGGLALQAFPVPHDAREPVQYVVSGEARKFGLLTDAGHVTEHMISMLEECDAVAIECNHDVEMLHQGGYPQALKARILGRYGHLDNAVSATLLKRIAHPRMQHVVAAHLSEENNTPDLARCSLAEVMDCSSDWIGVADQYNGLEWREIA